jgi:hypothetical protein
VATEKIKGPRKSAAEFSAYVKNNGRKGIQFQIVGISRKWQNPMSHLIFFSNYHAPKNLCKRQLNQPL